MILPLITFTLPSTSPDVLIQRLPILDFSTPGQDRGSYAVMAKATYPALFGLDYATARADALLAQAMQAIDDLGDAAEGLRWLARDTMLRSE